MAQANYVTPILNQPTDPFLKEQLEEQRRYNEEKAARDRQDAKDDWERRLRVGDELHRDRMAWDLEERRKEEQRIYGRRREDMETDRLAAKQRADDYSRLAAQELPEIRTRLERNREAHIALENSILNDGRGTFRVGDDTYDRTVTFNKKWMESNGVVVPTSANRNSILGSTNATRRYIAQSKGADTDAALALLDAYDNGVSQEKARLKATPFFSSNYVKLAEEQRVLQKRQEMAMQGTQFGHMVYRGEIPPGGTAGINGVDMGLSAATLDDADAAADLTFGGGGDPGAIVPTGYKPLGKVTGYPTAVAPVNFTQDADGNTLTDIEKDQANAALTDEATEFDEEALEYVHEYGDTFGYTNTEGDSNKAWENALGLRAVKLPNGKHVRLTDEQRIQHLHNLRLKFEQAYRNSQRTLSEQLLTEDNEWVEWDFGGDDKVKINRKRLELEKDRVKRLKQIEDKLRTLGWLPEALQPLKDSDIQEMRSLPLPKAQSELGDGGVAISSGIGEINPELEGAVITQPDMNVNVARGVLTYPGAGGVGQQEAPLQDFDASEWGESPLRLEGEMPLEPGPVAAPPPPPVANPTGEAVANDMARLVARDEARADIQSMSPTDVDALLSGVGNTPQDGPSASVPISTFPNEEKANLVGQIHQLFQGGSKPLPDLTSIQISPDLRTNSPFDYSFFWTEGDIYYKGEVSKDTGLIVNLTASQTEMYDGQMEIVPETRMFIIQNGIDQLGWLN